MRTGQVQGIIFTFKDNKISYLLLKRNEKKGGFWQPMTGGIEGEETPVDALKREINEELSLNDAGKIIDFDYHFFFTLENGQTLKEYVFGVNIDHDAKFLLSDEHVDSKWVSCEQALKMLKWESNKNALKALNSYLIKGGA